MTGRTRTATIVAVCTAGALALALAGCRATVEPPVDPPCGAESPDSVCIGQFVYYDEPPLLLWMPKPEYPPEALARGLEGTVHVWARIGTTGTVTGVHVATPVWLLDEAAVVAVRGSRWQPATYAHRPVAIWVDVPVKFALNAPAATPAAGPRRAGGLSSGAPGVAH